MSLSSALYAGLSGMAANSQILSITGNNLANVATTAYKDTEANFQTQIYQTLNEGTAPTNTTGGTNPEQLGLGTELAGITTNFTPGSVVSTGVSSDLALSGSGFFILNSSGNTLYTRAGNFNLNSNNDLINSSGAYVQGYSVDNNFNIIPGKLGDLNIPLGSLTIAQPTQNITVTGNLNASGTVASTRATTTGDELFSDSGATTPADGTTLLTSLFDSSGSGNPLFQTGEVITVSGATEGTTSLPARTFEIGATNTTGSDANGTTYQDLANFLGNALGINTSISGDPAGVQINNGQLVVTGNDGTVNDVTLNSSDLTVSNGSSISQPFTFTKTGVTNGESVTTTAVAYDSLGTPINVNLSFVLESTGATGTTWRYYGQSTDNPDASPAVGTGLISFNNNGQLEANGSSTITLQRNNGAAPSQSITLQMAGSGGNGVGGLSAFTNDASQITGTSDGSSIGTLESYAIGDDGTITGTFSNSQTRTLGQVALANFINPQGLSNAGANNYEATATSGSAAVVTAGTGGTGAITGGALEQSNVDLSAEFVNLIAATTGFSANSRVITTGDTMIQELLTMIQ